MATQAPEKPKSSTSNAPSRRSGSKKPGRPTSDTSTTALVGTVVAGAALGIAAMIGRKFAVQAPTYFAGNWDEALAAEHKATMAIFDALEATSTSNTTKRSMLLTQLKHALAKHALEEENTVYPALRNAGLDDEADRLTTDHGYVKQYLYDLTNCPNDSVRFLQILGEFRSDVERHVQEEETTLFPELKAKLSTEENKALTTAMNREGFKLA
jgi:hemerythrin superfamily protein